MVFWKIYGVFYDTVAHLIPYKKMLEKVILRLDCKDGDLVLDAGCGTGNLEVLLQNTGINLKVEAVDYSKDMIERASKKLSKNHNKNAQINLLKIDLNKKLPYLDNQFDKIVCINVIYALSNPRYTCNEFYRVLKKDGRLILITPHKGSKNLPILLEHIKQTKSLRILTLLPNLIIVWIFNLIISLRSTVGSYKFFDEKEIVQILEDCNFQEISLEYCYADTALLLVCTKK